LTENNKRSFSNDVGFTLITRVFTAAFQFFFRIGIALLIGPSDQGLFFWFLQTVLVCTAIFSIGTGTSAVYYLPKYPDKQNTYITSVFFIVTGAATFWIIAGLFLIKFLNTNTIFPVPISLIIIAIVLFDLLNTLYSIFIGLQKSKIFNQLALAQVLLQLVTLFLFFTIFKSKLSSTIYSYMFSIGIIFVTALLILIIKCHFKFSFSITNFKQQFIFGISAWLPALMYLVNLRLSFYMIQSFCGTAQSGIFSLALILSEILWFIPDSITTILLPKISGETDFSLKRNFGNTISRFTVLATICTSIFLSLSGIVFFHYFKQYSSSTIPFLLLIPGVAIYSICKITSTMLVALGKLAIANISSLIMLIINVLLCVYLIPQFNTNGAAIATGLTYLTGSIIAFVYYSRLTQSTLSDFLIPRYSDLKKIKVFITDYLLTIKHQR
jgi:O-antigen/teichoic acid export membrane protein